eukprot:g17376.t1
MDWALWGFRVTTLTLRLHWPLQGAAQLAYARGDRAGYEAAVRAYTAHTEQAAWSAYVEQERLAQAAAYHHALHRNFEAAQAHALYAEAARLEGAQGLPPVMEPTGHPQWPGMGAAADATAQLDALNALKRHGGDAGDRAAPTEKAMLGGREDVMELLQSILPSNARINVAPGAGAPTPQASAAALQGGFRGRGYGVPGTPHGVGLGDPRLNPVLGAASRSTKVLMANHETGVKRRTKVISYGTKILQPRMPLPSREQLELNLEVGDRLCDPPCLRRSSSFMRTLHSMLRLHRQLPAWLTPGHSPCNRE